MDTKLLLAIERAENEYCEIEDLQEAILALSNRKVSTLVLLLALRDAVINHENYWQEVEEMPVFKLIYGDDRDKARKDFLCEINRKRC